EEHVVVAEPGPEAGQDAPGRSRRRRPGPAQQPPDTGLGPGAALQRPGGSTVATRCPASASAPAVASMAASTSGWTLTPTAPGLALTPTRSGRSGGATVRQRWP